jgi:RNA polymerase sigma-70 factor (ECF subfamily)
MNRHPLATGSVEDAELVERVKSGHPEAFGELVLRYQDRLFNTCWRICGHMEDARDITQQAFLRAYEALPGFRHESGFYTWIYRVAVNLALSHRRSAARHRLASLDGSPQSGTQAENLTRDRITAADAAERSADTADLQRAVAHALQELPEDDRAVLVLRDIEGFDYQEIAGILEVPTGTVKSRLHRARMALREAVAPSNASGS